MNPLISQGSVRPRRAGMHAFLFQPMLHESTFVEVPEVLVGVDWPLVVLGIFLFNLVLSSFLGVTLSGLVFFPLSAVLGLW